MTVKLKYAMVDITISGFSFLKAKAIAITAFLAKGEELESSVNNAKTYVTNAINKAETQISKFNFDIFTDDIDWVNSHKIFKEANNIFYSSNSVEDTIETFSKMLVFENFIISNSTYSLIAALLGEKSNSNIYYPDPWFRNEDNTLKLKKNWIKLPNNG